VDSTITVSSDHIVFLRFIASLFLAPCFIKLDASQFLSARKYTARRNRSYRMMLTDELDQHWSCSQSSAVCLLVYYVCVTHAGAGGKPLFKRAILHDGSALASWAMVTDPLRYAYDVADAVNCSVPRPTGRPQRRQSSAADRRGHERLAAVRHSADVGRNVLQDQDRDQDRYCQDQVLDTNIEWIRDHHLPSTAVLTIDTTTDITKQF